VSELGNSDVGLDIVVRVGVRVSDMVMLRVMIVINSIHVVA